MIIGRQTVPNCPRLGQHQFCVLIVMFPITCPVLVIVKAARLRSLLRRWRACRVLGGFGLEGLHSDRLSRRGVLEQIPHDFRGGLVQCLVRAAVVVVLAESGDPLSQLLEYGRPTRVGRARDSRSRRRGNCARCG